MYRHSRSSLAPWYARAQMPAGKEKPQSLSSDSSSFLKLLLTEIETPIKKPPRGRLLTQLSKVSEVLLVSRGWQQPLN
jgi:hypothetical protein